MKERAEFVCKFDDKTKDATTNATYKSLTQHPFAKPYNQEKRSQNANRLNLILKFT